MRKVKHAGHEFGSRLVTILTEFPRLEDEHQFNADLINVLYDRDHYDMNVTKNIMEKISNEFIKLLKFADSLYRCKQLKRAAFGRMASAANKLGKTLEYLEEVRMHMTRLPTIDPAAKHFWFVGF